MNVTATTAMPYERLEWAPAAVRAEHRRQLLHAGVCEMPVRETFAVGGPFRTADGRGRTWFQDRSTVESRGPFAAARGGGAATK